MLSVRPLVVADGYVLGGNMRLLVLKELGYREVDVIDVSDWTKAQRDEFMIKDNLSFGDWDWDILANEWDVTDLNEWGLDLWDEEELTKEKLKKPSIKIEFEEEDYDIAFDSISNLKDEDKYVGGIILEALRKVTNGTQ